MVAPPDPFVHHPALRDRIVAPLTSFFRTFEPAAFDAQMKAGGWPDDWRYSDADREALRKHTLAGRLGQDLWVFAYGSLMWDPAFHFAELRRGSITSHSRCFSLKDTFGGRGSREVPGLMVALDKGDGCHGLAFRIAAEHVDRETEILWRRELITSTYVPAFVRVSTDFGQLEALTVVANRASADICPDLSRAEQVRYIATGKGFLGTSLQYCENIAAQLDLLGLQDASVSGLVADARAYEAGLR